MLLPLTEVLTSDLSSCHQAATGWGKKFQGENMASGRMGKWDFFEQPLILQQFGSKWAERIKVT